MALSLFKRSFAKDTTEHNVSKFREELYHITLKRLANFTIPIYYLFWFTRTIKIFYVHTLKTYKLEFHYLVVPLKSIIDLLHGFLNNFYT